MSRRIFLSSELNAFKALPRPFFLNPDPTKRRSLSLGRRPNSFLKSCLSASMFSGGNRSSEMPGAKNAFAMRTFYSIF